MQLLRIIQICRQIRIPSEHKNKSANSHVHKTKIQEKKKMNTIETQCFIMWRVFQKELL